MNLGAKLVIMMVWLMSMIQVGMQDATEHPFEYIQVDIVVLLDDSGSISDDEVGKLTDFIGKMTEKFPMDGGKQTRLALITFSNVPVVRTPNGFVTTTEQFKEALDHTINNREKGHTQTQVALPTVKGFFLEHDTRPDVPNVLLIMTDGCTNDGPGGNVHQAMADAEKTAKEMLDKGVKIFLVYVGGDECESSGQATGMNPTEHQLKLTGNNPDHQIKYDNFDQLGDEVFDAIKDEFKSGSCKYIHVCYYSDNTKSTCNGDWMKNVRGSRPNCTDLKPEQDQCDVTDCERHCDEQWQMENCDNCEEMPEMLEWCKDACERCKLTEQPETEPEKEHAAMAPPPKAEKPTTEKSHDKSAGFPLWAVIVIGAFGLLLLIAFGVLLGVMVQRRSRRRQIWQGGQKGKTAGGGRSKDKMKRRREQQSSTSKTTLSKKFKKTQKRRDQ